ncbi:peptidoglycan/xylan/chitin deacetylase (PgdA/CDA1 family) [Mucilaginibacter yixingensis]|uniref:Peptidoglycan/xylan/chitin deacetylase (PgdA/CDA1 family) n=1 Tax=Mucilaginibacter yixingensis TaxID=1295612 RepID=A0A2T5JB30_9SPHI|nr:polysaccharide deacetylase family protein [Mucilaginibacter yixingensis]PTQ98078.1 peptidoglycan/xylan/chitin deacetylase (PgdA/CDA1 family) [Mucilaginibacter yixingensis]
MKGRYWLMIVFLMVSAIDANAQSAVWKNKKCAVVLTYDDALDVDIDNALPVLDSLKLKATFYLIGCSEATERRMKDWRKAARHGHELGNHTLFHPCDGAGADRSFVDPDFDLSKYTVNRAVREIKVNNVLLKAIDGKNQRTFCYPCGDRTINGAFYYDQLKNDFVAARGVEDGMPLPGEVDLDNINAYAINGETGEELIAMVNEALQKHSLLVFMFHGVGGGHELNVSLQAHSQLLHYLRAHRKEIWVAPMIEVAQRIAAYQKGSDPLKNRNLNTALYNR